MKNTKRSAFTIVELVIVIAVIAILSAVLIPTFGSIIKDANIAADKAAASSLTTELHVYLKGDVIVNEADLVKALQDAMLNFNESKLTPKSAQYGYHYWYDIENQTIVCETSKNISESRPKKDNALANTSFRDVYGNGYYLIDGSGDFADIINGIDNIADAEDYVEIIDKVASAATESNDTALAEKIQETLGNTTIKNEAGSFFTNGESDNEYFSANSTYVGSNYVDVNTNNGNSVNENATAAPAPSKPVEVPSHIETAFEGSLNYSTEDGEKVEIVVNSSEQLANGALNHEDNNVQVNIGETIYTPNENGNIVDEEGNELELTTKLPFADFVIGTPDTKDTTASDKIYVAYRNNYLQLHAVNAANSKETSNKVENWEVIAGEFGSFEIDSQTGRINLSTASFEGNVCEVTVKATANNMNGEVVEKEINVVVVKALSVTVSLGSTLVYPTTNGNKPEVTFNGALTSYGMKIGATYSGDKDGKNPLNITPKYEVSNLAGLAFDNGKLTFLTNNKGELVEGINFMYTITVDGIVSQDVELEVKDATAAAVKFEYNQYLHANRPNYQIGTNTTGTNTEIKLSDLFKIANVDKLGNAKVNIYATAEVGDQFYPSYEIHSMFVKYADAVANGDITAAQNTFTLDAEYTREVNKDTFSSATIKFSGTVTSSYKVFIEIVPEHDVSTVVKVEIVNNAINVTKATDLAKTHTTNVVLHKDVELTSGQKIDLGANSLYGNGWIINAKSFISSTKTVKDYFINLTNGTIDNVYIDGPIYPEFEYESSTLGYHVSGVKVTGTATIQNSYIAGFRQPISVDAGNLTLKNSTLYGGNYANLNLIKGTLTLEDVTTVQPKDGIADTFSKGKNVIGLGIVVEDDAVDGTTSKITVNGYLDQYNWVPENSTADFPTLTVDGTDLDMKKVLAAMYNGMTINVLGSNIERKLAFLDAYMEEVDGVKYLNTGVMFLSIGPTKNNIASTTYSNDSKLTLTDNRTNGGTTATTKFTAQPLPLFSDYVVLEKSIIKLTADKAMRLLEDFTIGDDGKVKGSISLKIFNSLSNPLDVYLKVWTYKNTDVTLGADGYPINWTEGYYVDYNN